MSWIDPPPLVEKPRPPSLPIHKPKRYRLFLGVSVVFWVAIGQALWWIAAFLFHWNTTPFAWGFAAVFAVMFGLYGFLRTRRAIIDLMRLAEQAGWSAETKGDKM